MRTFESLPAAGCHRQASMRMDKAAAVIEHVFMLIQEQQPRKGARTAREFVAVRKFVTMHKLMAVRELVTVGQFVAAQATLRV
jgi:hypothetical protein